MNNSLKKVLMSKQSPKERIKNFDEVAFGYTAAQAMEEAERCLECKHKPCVAKCPVSIKIPDFISLIKKGDFEAAYLKIREDSNLPAVCGRVCPQEEQCELVCVRGIKGEPVAIGNLERFVADWYMQNCTSKKPVIKTNGVKVAVVGAGPAGLTFAADAAKYGYDVTILEALHKPGGVLIYGIPEFRLPKALVSKELENLKDLGVKFSMNVLVGRSVTVGELFEEGFKGIFIGSGAGLPTFMNIAGENFNGVLSANEYLTRVNLMQAYKDTSPTPVKKANKVAVIGAGNVAMDAARTALRLGAAEVTIVYRRGKEEIPARHEEVENAEEEGVQFKLLTAPLEILGQDFKVTGLRCQVMELGEPDASGRRRPIPVVGKEFTMDVDLVIIAIGQSPNPLLTKTTKGLESHKWGGLVVNEETLETSKPDVYAGGDAVTGAATVILAMGAGKKAAYAMHEKFKKEGVVKE